MGYAHIQKIPTFETCASAAHFMWCSGDSNKIKEKKMNGGIKLYIIFEIWNLNDSQAKPNQAKLSLCV